MAGLALRFDHQRRDDRVLRKTLLYFSNLPEVDVNRAVADELDIIEAHHALILKVYRPITGTGIDNRFADRLPDRSTPSRFERDRKSTRLNSSHQIISYAVFCLKKKKI